MTEFNTNATAFNLGHGLVGDGSIGPQQLVEKKKAISVIDYLCTLGWCLLASWVDGL